MKKIYLITLLTAILYSCGSNQIPEGAVGIYKSESMSGMFLGKKPYETTNWISINPKAKNPIGLFTYSNLGGRFETTSEGWKEIKSIEEISEGKFEIKCDAGSLNLINFTVDTMSKIITTKKGGVDGEYTLKWKSKSPCFSEKNCDCNPNCMSY